jgi:hypothetical protein
MAIYIFEEGAMVDEVSTKSRCPVQYKPTSSTNAVSHGSDMSWWSSMTFAPHDCRRHITDPSSTCSQTHHASERTHDLRSKPATSAVAEVDSSVARCPLGTRSKGQTMYASWTSIAPSTNPTYGAYPVRCRTRQTQRFDLSTSLHSKWMVFSITSARTARI